MNLLSDKNIYALHKWFGLVSGLFLLMLSLTGIVLLFDDELDATLNPQIVKVTPAAQRRPMAELRAIIEQKYPEAQINSTKWQSENPEIAFLNEIQLGKKRLMVHQNQYTGAITGERERNNLLVRKILMLHEHLTIGEWGHFILLLVGLCLLGLVATGLWYYRRSLFGVFKIGVRQRNAYLKNSDLHKLTGVTAFAFLIVMGVTGSFMHWEKVEKMFDKPQEREDNSTDKPLIIRQMAIQNIDSLLVVSTVAVAGFVPQEVRYPKAQGDAVVVRGSRPESNRFFGELNTSIDFTANSAPQITHKEDADLEANLEASMEQIHFGKFWGVWSRVLYAIGSFGLSAMTITGFVIWWKKRK